MEEKDDQKRCRTDHEKHGPKSVSLIFIWDEGQFSPVVCYDEDLDREPQVRMALERLQKGEHLQMRGPWPRKPKQRMSPSGSSSTEAIFVLKFDLVMEKIRPMDERVVKDMAQEGVPGVREDRELPLPFRATADRPVSRVYVIRLDF